MLSESQYLLGALSGALVGFSLALIGGGGSILATPLIVYLVGVRDPHLAIGTSALAVAANAALGLANHARASHVRWSPGLWFAAAGVAGAFAGSAAGKSVDGQRLLFLFALLMILVGVLMLRRRGANGAGRAEPAGFSRPKVLGVGLVAGVVSGFFGIGGGFLIVPGLIASARLAMINAVGTSLIAVTAFGLTTALNYALSGWVDWLLAGVFILGGIVGSLGGARAARRLSDGGQLTIVFSTVIFAVAAYMLWHSGSASFG